MAERPPDREFGSKRNSLKARATTQRISITARQHNQQQETRWVSLSCRTVEISCRSLEFPRPFVARNRTEILRRFGPDEKLQGFEWFSQVIHHVVNSSHRVWSLHEKEGGGSGEPFTSDALSSLPQLPSSTNWHQLGVRQEGLGSFVVLSKLLSAPRTYNFFQPVPILWRGSNIRGVGGLVHHGGSGSTSSCHEGHTSSFVLASETSPTATPRFHHDLV